MIYLQYFCITRIIKNLKNLEIDLNSVKYIETVFHSVANYQKKILDNVDKHNKIKLYSYQKDSPIAFKFSKTKIFDLNRDLKKRIRNNIRRSIKIKSK